MYQRYIYVYIYKMCKKKDDTQISVEQLAANVETVREKKRNRSKWYYDEKKNLKNIRSSQTNVIIIIRRIIVQKTK